MPSPISNSDRDAIQQLQFYAKGVVEGITAGRHRSQLKGSSVEFKEHREYVRGDEIRSIDWKLFGKTDRLFIRQYEDETNLKSLLMLDQSGSMGYQSKRGGSISKHQYAVQLTACLAMLLLRQQDSVGLVTLDTAPREILPARSNLGHLSTIYETLVRSKTGGETSLGTALTQAGSKLKQRGLVILVSDCFDQVDRLVKGLGMFRHRGHEVILFQVWDPDELEFPFRNRTEFRSLENSDRQLVDPHGLRRAYLQRVEEFRSQLARETAKLRIDLVPCLTTSPCGDVIAEYLAGRQGKTGRPRSHSGAT